MKNRARGITYLSRPLPSHNPYVGNFKQEDAMFLSTDDRYTAARAVKHTA